MKYRLQQPSRRRRSPGLSQPRFRVPVGIAIGRCHRGLGARPLAVESIAIADLPKQSGSFKVADIQLQGLQRVSSGTVFNLLPGKRRRHGRHRRDPRTDAGIVQVRGISMTSRCAATSSRWARRIRTQRHGRP